MKTWLIGIFIFLLWSAGATYWYVCRIKGLCPQGEMASIPSSLAVEGAPKQDATQPQDSTPASEKQPSKAPAAIPASLAQPMTVLFAFAGPIPENPSAFEAYLTDLSNYLLADPSRQVSLLGYTDDTAARENNLKLAQRRCDVIAKMLADKGIKADQIVSEAKGEVDPVATNDTQEGRRRNRRVVISILH